jgi:hypothetical protein
VERLEQVGEGEQAEDPQQSEAQAATLDAAGFDVTVCSGPSRRDDRACSLLAHGYCAQAYTADVIVNGLPLDHLRVYVAQRAYLPDCPVLLSLNERERARHPIVDSLAATIPRNLTGEALVAAVEAAADDRPVIPAG